jgi:hypothetical protein
MPGGLHIIEQAKALLAKPPMRAYRGKSLPCCDNALKLDFEDVAVRFRWRPVCITGLISSRPFCSLHIRIATIRRTPIPFRGAGLRQGKRAAISAWGTESATGAESKTVSAAAES